MKPLIDGRHPYGNINPCSASDVADKVLNEYWDIAESLGIQSFLCFGTCLGFVRDRGYVTNDNDIDIGILGGLEDLTAKLVKNGFMHRRSYGKNRHFLKDGILLDIWFKFSCTKFLQFFNRIEYKGRFYEIPHPVEGYLTARYGDWKTVKHRRVWEG